MKRYYITQTGKGESELSREFILEVPDDVDPKSFDHDQLEEMADKAEVLWEVQDCWEEAEDTDINEEAISEEDAARWFENTPIINSASFAEEEGGVK